MTVIGEWDKASGDLLASLYQHLPAPVIRKSIEVAEMVKYSCNVWHATKISFANEIGNIAKSFGVDGRQVMDVVCQDSRSEEHTSDIQSLMRISYAVFFLQKKTVFYHL